jgi:hypothetical protein
MFPSENQHFAAATGHGGFSGRADLAHKMVVARNLQPGS